MCYTTYYDQSQLKQLKVAHRLENSCVLSRHELAFANAVHDSDVMNVKH